MYREFFGFRERPFDLSPNSRFLVLTSAHGEALSTLTYGIAARKGITLLIGDAGTGKTTVIRAAIARQAEQVHCVHLQNPALTRAEFLEMLAVRFNLDEEARRSKTALLLQLEAMLLAQRARGESTVLIVDEAQSVPGDILEEIRLLANIETEQEKLLPVVLAGQPELGERLHDRALRQLKQRIALRCELRPLTLVETFAYVAGRIRAAGGIGAQVFTKEAVTLLHERSGGIPRTVSVLADNALLNGFALGRKPITGAIVQEVCRDFDVATAEPAEQLPAPALTAPGAARVTALPHRSRILTVGEPEAVAEAPAVAHAADAAPGGAGNGGLFTSLTVKRRRFLFF